MVKIRLQRRGRKKLSKYRIVVADVRAPRDGRFIASLGYYDPHTNPALVNIDPPTTIDWLLKGAQPTATVRSILSKQGILFRKHLQVGLLKKAISQADMDNKLANWHKKQHLKSSNVIEHTIVVEEDKHSKKKE